MTKFAAIVATLLFASSASATTLAPSTRVIGTLDLNLTTIGISGQARYYEFEVGDQDVNVQFSLVDNRSNGSDSLYYALYEDTDPTLSRVNPGSLLAEKSLTNVANNTSIPLFTYLLQKGKDYVLKIDPSLVTWRTTTNISAVPLPTAFWLFGSALLGFVTLSNRRKI